jgi:hypothetical protein
MSVRVCDIHDCAICLQGGLVQEDYLSVRTALWYMVVVITTTFDQ